MADYKEKIAEFEKELSSMQYNKRTQHHYGLVRAKIAKLREAQEKRGRQKSKHDGYEVRRTGDGTVLLLGFPSTGKSTLLNRLTNAESDVGAYAFTTLSVVPGVMEHKHARIQLLDVPGIVRGAATGRGRGKEVLSCMQSADMALILVDATKPEELGVIRKEVYETRIRLDERKPDVRIRKTIKDGVRVGRTVKTPLLDDETITAILKEFKVNNAEVTIRTRIDADQFIDVVEGNRKYMPSVVVLNKIDLLTKEELEKVEAQVKPHMSISAKNQGDLESLKELIFQRLDLIRLYLKEPGKAADKEEPLIVFRNAKIRDVCNKLHKDFVKKFKFARVWGPSAKFAGQRLTLRHVLKEGDVLEIHLQ